MRLVILYAFITLFLAETFSQTYPNRYWIRFTDKNNNPYSLERPEEFLSERAIQRRLKQNIAFSFNDLPVTPAYIDSLKAMGVPVYNISKWFNAITTDSISTELLNRIYDLPFVARPSSQESQQKIKVIENSTTAVTSAFDNWYTFYGYSQGQIIIHNGHFLHQQGFSGAGMQIALIDAGFLGVDVLSGFEHLWNKGRILGTRDFVERNSSIYRKNAHGMHVLSVIAGNIPYEFVGTAPDASFWLLRSEDVNSEYLIEEDNWVSAAEYADSAGVDIINTSLGYAVFDDSTTNHTYEDMDGNSTRISIAADIAASKGILVIASAGNQGNSTWKYITSPADADSVLAIGATDELGIIASFSSVGPTYDGRIKPDVCAVGKATTILRQNGSVGSGSGTSLSAPVITGLAACLWQANPDATNMEIFSAILESSDRFTNPDTIYGYGIPDFNKADIICKTKYNNISDDFYSLNVFPNPFIENINIIFYSGSVKTVSLIIYDATGRITSEMKYSVNNGYNEIIINNLSDLSSGIYFLRIQSENNFFIHKLIKL